MLKFISRLSRKSEPASWGEAGAWKNKYFTPRAVAGFELRAERAATLIKPGTSVLDVGAGTCPIRPFLPSGVTYSACDLSPVVTGIQKINLDALEFPKGSWDYVLFLGVLSWIVEKEWTLRTARECSRHVIVTNGDAMFKDLLARTGWTLKDTVMFSRPGDANVPIDLYG